MPEQTIEHNGVTVVVSAANVRQGMKRTRLRMEAAGAKEDDQDRMLLRLFTYPDLTASAVSVVGMAWPLDFEAFLLLPDALVGKWEKACYELNPHWLPGGGPTPDPKA